MATYQTATIDKDVLLFLGGKLGYTWVDAPQKCSDFAYRDMCRTIDYAPALKGTSFKANAAKNQLKEAVLDTIVWELLVPALKKKKLTQGKYNTLFYKTCNEIISLYEGKTVQDQAETPNSLYFGQVQKWVNMTMKNLFAFCRMHQDRSLDHIFPFMHIPIDSIVIDILADKKKCPCDEGCNIQYGIAKPQKVWSQFNRTEYISYQIEARKKIAELFSGTEPLRWELQHWNSTEE